MISLMLMTLLAQGTPPSTSFATWEGLRLIFELVLSVLMPMLIFQLTAMRKRLEDGDKKFAKLGEKDAARTVETHALQTAWSELGRKIEKLMEKNTELQVEALGAVANLESSIERRFATKEELRRTEERVAQQYAAILSEIRKGQR